MPRLLCLLLSSLLIPAVAIAAKKVPARAGAAHDPLADGEAAYQDGKFADALRILAAHLQKEHDPSLRKRALRMVFAAAFYEGDKAASEAAIKELVTLDPSATAIASEYPPQLVAFFDQAKAKAKSEPVVVAPVVETPPAPEVPVEIRHTAPAPDPTLTGAGTALVIVGAAGAATSVALFIADAILGGQLVRDTTAYNADAARTDAAHSLLLARRQQLGAIEVSALVTAGVSVAALTAGVIMLVKARPASGTVALGVGVGSLFVRGRF